MNYGDLSSIYFGHFRWCEDLADTNEEAEIFQEPQESQEE